MSKRKLPIPDWLKRFLIEVRYQITSRPYRGTGRICPVCEQESQKFKEHKKRLEAECIYCRSLERHRFVWFFLNSDPHLLAQNNGQLLHVAPEECLQPLFKKQLGANYLSADLFSPLAMVKMDVTDIQYEAESFGAIYCSHVLEHVADDQRAMSEFYRVLKQGGWAILNVPIHGETTYEDPSIVDPAERLKHFGQEDHVRIYGADYVERLKSAGFQVKVVTVNDVANAEQIVQMGLTSAAGEIFYCTKE